MPHPTHPEGEMNVPKKQRSRVELCGWYVHAIEACCVGSEMHFSNVFVDVVVVHLPETEAGSFVERRRKRVNVKVVVDIATTIISVFFFCWLNQYYM